MPIYLRNFYANKINIALKEQKQKIDNIQSKAK